MRRFREVVCDVAQISIDFKEVIVPDRFRTSITCGHIELRSWKDVR